MEVSAYPGLAWLIAVGFVPKVTYTIQVEELLDFSFDHVIFSMKTSYDIPCV